MANSPVAAALGRIGTRAYDFGQSTARKAVMKFLPKLCACFAMIAAVGHAGGATGQGLPAPAAFCIDHPSACGHCPNCAKNQIDITIQNAAGERTCAANGGTVVMNASGNKVCGGHYMRRQGPPQSQPGPLPH